MTGWEHFFYVSGIVAWIGVGGIAALVGLFLVFGLKEM